MTKWNEVLNILKTALLILVLGFMLANLFIPEWGNWKRNKQQVDRIRSSMDSTRQALENAREILDSMQKGMNQYHQSVDDMKMKIEQLEKERRLSQERFNLESKRIRQRLKELHALPDSNVLPVIIIE